MKASEGLKVEEVVKNDEVVEVEPATAIAAYEQAQIDSQIATAKKYPRSIGGAIQNAKNLATWDREVAEACTYALPARKGSKPVTGPSVRLAEIMAVTWGNLSAGARPAQEGEKFVTGLGFCHDLENNVRFVFEVRRRITYKDGTRYSDDMINQTAQAASAIAFRNAVFKTIPMAFTLRIQREAQKTARGEEKGLEQRRQDALKRFEKEKGISKAQVLNAIGCKGEEEIAWPQIDLLLGMWAAIETGESTAEELFPPVPTNLDNIKTGRTKKKEAVPEKEEEVDPELKKKAEEAKEQLNEAVTVSGRSFVKKEADNTPQQEPEDKGEDDEFDEF